MTPLRIAANSAEEVICKAEFLRDRPEMNTGVWLRGLMGAVLSRADMQGLHKPSLVEIMPTMMINNVVLEEARRASILPTRARVSF